MFKYYYSRIYDTVDLQTAVYTVFDDVAVVRYQVIRVCHTSVLVGANPGVRATNEGWRDPSYKISNIYALYMYTH